jgi:D-alanyl-lipoteichoic acid acyltransferase DltB (MBOAT superfamily)
MATLLSAFHIFSTWKKVHQHLFESRLWHAFAVFITFNAVCFGLLIFSGHIGAVSNAQRTSEKLSMLKNVP